MERKVAPRDNLVRGVEDKVRKVTVAATVESVLLA